MIAAAKEQNNSSTWKWVKPRSLHLTLHFLDEQNEEKIKNIIQISERVAENFSPSDVTVGEWGAFPNFSQPRIFFISLKDSDTLIRLHDELARELEQSGFKIDKRPWQTHVTVARNKSPRPKKLILPEIKKGLDWKMQSFELMKSNLLADGAEYEIVKSFKL